MSVVVMASVVVVVIMIVMVVVTAVVPMVVMPAMSVVVVTSMVVVVFMHGGLFHAFGDGRHGSYDRGGNDVGEEGAVDAEEDSRYDYGLHVGRKVGKGFRERKERHERRRLL